MTGTPVLITVALLLIATKLTAQDVGGPADLVLLNGRIFTADVDQPWAEAVAIRGERIIAVGSSAEIAARAGSGTRRIDLGNRVAIPGINDAHIHSSAAATMVPIPAAGPDPRLAELLDSLRVVVDRTAPGTWLSGTVGRAVQDDPRATRFVLDSITPRHPVMLLDMFGHGLLLNSAAMRALAIDEEEPDPVGGWYERVEGGHRLTGVLHGYANFSARARREGMADDAAAVAALRSDANTFAEFGITSVQDMAAAGAGTTARRLTAAQVPIRWRLIHFPGTDTAGRMVPTGDFVQDGRSAHLNISGVKWILEGTPVERGVLLREAYADEAGWHGRPYFPVDSVRAIVAEALLGPSQMLLHVAGDSLLSVLFAAMNSAAPDSVWQRLRLRIEHGDFLMPDQFAEARRLGVVIVQNPAHLTLAEVMEARFGDRAPYVQPLRSLIESGIPVALGSDGPINPFLNIMFASTHPANPGEALTREQAVLAYTRGSAYAEFMENEKGVIAPGFLADIAVLSQDIFSVENQALPGTTSVLTIIGGRVVHERGEREP